MRRFDEELSPTARSACRKELVLSSVDPRTTLIELPQRAIRRPHTSAPIPPLAEMLAVGRGGADVRVRLYLWLWATSAARNFEPYRRTSGEWALLLNLLPAGRERNHRTRNAAARRVTTASRYLEGVDLILRATRGTLRVLDPDRSGNRYEQRTSADFRALSAKRAELSRRFGITNFNHTDVWEEPPLYVPVALWLNGSVSGLSGAALAAFLLLWDIREREADDDGTIWVPKTKAYQYCIRNDVWHKGVSELVQFGCVHRVKGKVLFAAGTNPRVAAARHRVGWRLNRKRLFGLNREQLPA